MTPVADAEGEEEDEVGGLGLFHQFVLRCLWFTQDSHLRLRLLVEMRETGGGRRAMGRRGRDDDPDQHCHVR